MRARYYSPGIGRFISEDPARDGLNWYAYCGNNPIMFVDPTGQYSIKNNGNGTYTLKKAEYWYIFGKAVALQFSPVPFTEYAIELVEKKGFKYISGNSMTVADNYTDASKEMIKNTLGEVAGKVFKVTDTIENFGKLNSEWSIAYLDSIAFGLLQNAGISLTSDNPEQLKKYIEKAYSFIAMQEDYFGKSMGSFFNYKTMHQIDYELSQSKKPQKLLNDYQKRLESYFISVMHYDAAKAKNAANYYTTYFDDYAERRQEMFDLFKIYINN